MDAWILELVQRLASPHLNDLVLLLSTAALVLLPGIALLMLFLKRWRRLALGLITALSATTALTLLFQALVMRPRPTYALADGSAFPSEHAALSFCVAALLSLTHRRAWVVAASLSGAILIGLSRVYLGHHHPSDVLGGALLGAGVGALAYGVWFGRGWLRWAVWLQLALVLVITLLAYTGLMPRGWGLGLPHADKLLHLILFGLLSFFLHLWLGGRWISFRLSTYRPALPLAGLLVLGGAAVEELLQLLSRRRSADPVDLMCDVAGIVAAIGLAELLSALSKKPIGPRQAGQACARGLSTSLAPGGASEADAGGPLASIVQPREERPHPPRGFSCRR